MPKFVSGPGALIFTYGACYFAWAHEGGAMAVSIALVGVCWLVMQFSKARVQNDVAVLRREKSELLDRLAKCEVDPDEEEVSA